MTTTNRAAYLTRPTADCPRFLAGLISLVSAIVRPFARRADRKDWEATVKAACETMANRPRVAKMLPQTGFRPAYLALPGAVYTPATTLKLTPYTPRGWHYIPAPVQQQEAAPAARPVQTLALPTYPAPESRALKAIVRPARKSTRKGKASECARQSVETSAPAFVADAPPADDGLDALSMTELRAVCEAENVRPARSKVDTIDRIRAARQGK